MSYNNIDTSKMKGEHRMCEPGKTMGMKQNSSLPKVNMMGSVMPKKNALPTGVIPPFNMK